MIIFWIAAALLSAGAGALMLQGAVRRGPALAEDPAVAVHRRQLAEIDQLAERGLLSETDHRAARAEAARRMLDAAEAAHPGHPVKSSGRLALLIVAAAAPLIAAGLYATVAGAPGTPDQPFLARVAAWKTGGAELGWPERVAVATVESQRAPKDPTLLKQLAVTQLFADDPVSAEAVVRRALAVSPKDPEVFTLLAASLTRQARQVTPQAAAALEQAQRLAEALPPGDPTRVRIDGQIRAVASMGAEGGRQAQAQPDGGQVTPARIRQMVEGLAARLKANPDDPKGWVMLVKAYSVMGETASRDAALAEARRRYAGDKAMLDQLEQAKDVSR